mgnify:CR=1 FL=1
MTEFDPEPGWIKARSSERRFGALIDALPDLLWLKDTEGVYLACNPQFERFFGARQADIVGKTDFDFVGREQDALTVAPERLALDLVSMTGGKEIPSCRVTAKCAPRPPALRHAGRGPLAAAGRGRKLAAADRADLVCGRGYLKHWWQLLCLPASRCSRHGRAAQAPARVFTCATTERPSADRL